MGPGVVVRGAAVVLSVKGVDGVSAELDVVVKDVDSAGSVATVEVVIMAPDPESFVVHSASKSAQQFAVLYRHPVSHWQ